MVRQESNLNWGVETGERRAVERSGSEVPSSAPVSTGRGSLKPLDQHLSDSVARGVCPAFFLSGKFARNRQNPSPIFLALEPDGKGFEPPPPPKGYKKTGHM